MTEIPNSELLSRARSGNVDALGELFERYRGALRATADQELSTRIKVRVSPSDILQATYLEVQRDLPDFRGEEVGQFVAWIKQILKNNVQQSIEMHRNARKRSVDRETSPDHSTGRGGRLLEGLAGPVSSPSHRLKHEEIAQRLARAIESLPPDQGEAARLRYLEGLKLNEICTHFGRSPTAVAGLLKRSLQKLRQHFSDELTDHLS